MVMTPVNDTPVIPNPPMVSCDALQAAAVLRTVAPVVVVVVGLVVVVLACVVGGVLVDDVDDVDGGEVEPVQAASVTARTKVTIAVMPSLRTVIIVSPISIFGASGTGVRRSRLTWTIRSV
jgi:hypothetical protein